MVIRKTTKIQHENPGIQDEKQANPQGKLVIIIVHKNTPDYLKICVPSIMEQTCKDFEVIFIDNGSKDREGVEFMHNAYDQNEKVTIIVNTDDRSFAKAANQGIRIAGSRGAKYVSIVNPDVVLSPDYYEKLISHSKKHPKVAGTTGKIYLFDLNNLKPTDIIDSTGLFAYKSRRIVDVGQGMVDDGKWSKDKEIFGASGICPLYSMEALENVKIMDEYFDEDMGQYEEDSDIAWRFLLYGWKSLYCAHAVAYHSRGRGHQVKFTTREFLKSRKSINKIQKQDSFRNQLIMQAKNELWGTFFRDFLTILAVKIITPFYVILVEPYLWRSYFEYFKKLPRILKKRGIISKNKKISAKEMSKWFKHRKQLLS
ncbi:MAG: glycosyltransferase family 2 protein [Candidatus Gracilibacteria bacterium]|jgi:GT2 family glycosyltransferase